MATRFSTSARVQAESINMSSSGSWINTCCLDGWCANIGNVTADEQCERPLSESTGEIKKQAVPSRSGGKKTVLLVDEVEVFFSKEVFGNTYDPVVALKSSEISALLDLIWKMRSDSSADILRVVKEKHEYELLKGKITA